MRHMAWERFWERVVGGFEYLMSVYITLAGALTIFASSDPRVHGVLANVYNSRIGLGIVGLLILTSGLILFLGKLRRSRKWSGRGLFAIYLCYFFATFLNMAAFGFTSYGSWIGNAIGILVMGLLWLRWKFKTQYVNPNRFKKEVVRIQYHERH